jgi:hypothetical protein
MQLHTVEPLNAPRVTTGALSPEVFTVSTLLSMPAVWTSVVERALPFDVLLERYLIVLLSIALIAELFRRLGEGGAILTPVDGATASRLDAGEDDVHGAPRRGDTLGRDGFGDDVFGGAGDLTSPLDSPLDGDLSLASPLALGGASTGDDLGLSDFGDLDSEFDLAPLDLNADPFPDPA